ALTFYVTASFGTLALLYLNSSVFFPLVFVGAWVTDTFAYFTGFFFGRHKLIPEVSPKKTIEGAIGGTLFATVGFAVVGIIYGYSTRNIIILAVIGIFASIVSQLGDLSASLVKRHHGIKDYGSLFPGHGGVLDRFDSILAVSAFLYVVSLFVSL
ncbi:MAG: phosphatidate cytidylyltransferase, partial [Clostridia bacterium]|nr:phosphatidate cytidylyltransferase [Clostridia bacterium]